MSEKLMPEGRRKPAAEVDSLVGLRGERCKGRGRHIEPRCLLEMPAAVAVVDMIGFGDERADGRGGDAGLLGHLAKGSLAERLTRFDHALGEIPTTIAMDSQEETVGVADDAASRLDKDKMLEAEAP